MIEQLLIDPAHWESMRAHVEAHAPLEACGLLAGIGDTVRAVLAVTNRAESPSRFRMDPAGQLMAFQLIEEGGLELLGIFHSHPADAGDGSMPAARPSDTDIREAAYPVVHVIWTRHGPQWQARGFWIEGGRVLEVPLHVIAGE